MRPTLEMAAHVPDFPLPNNLVARSRHAAAAFGAKRAAELLGARNVPRVQFVARSAKAGTADGAAVIGANIVHIVDGLTPSQTAGLAAHEAYHALADADETKAAAIQRQIAGEWSAGAMKRFQADIETLWEPLYGFASGEPRSPSVATIEKVFGSVQAYCAEVKLAEAELDALERFGDDRHPSALAQDAPPAPTALPFTRRGDDR